jgi:hypothetical protein
MSNKTFAWEDVDAHFESVLNPNRISGLGEMPDLSRQYQVQHHESFDFCDGEPEQGP